MTANPYAPSTLRARLRLWRKTRRVRRTVRTAWLLVAVAAITVVAHFGYALARDWRDFTRFQESGAAKSARMHGHHKAMFDELCVRQAPHKRESRAEKICTAIIEESLAAGITPKDGIRLVKIESNFSLSAMSEVGAFGLAQMRLSVHQPAAGCDLAMDARCNLRRGFEYYRHLLATFGSERLATTAYNRGQGTVRRLLLEGIDPVNEYYLLWKAVDV